MLLTELTADVLYPLWIGFAAGLWAVGGYLVTRRSFTAKAVGCLLLGLAVVISLFLAMCLWLDFG